MLSRNKKQDDYSVVGVEEGEHHHHSKPKTFLPMSSPTSTNTQEHSTMIDGFSLDLRSLALFRVVMGFVVIVDLCMRARNIFAHYANLGVWPVVEAISNLSPHSFSFHFSNGNIPFQLSMFLVGLVVAFFFMIGFKTKANNILLWLIILSLHNRNVLILNSGDDLLRIMLFWGLFLPLGDRFSVDCANQSGAMPTSTNRYQRFTSACFILQIVAMYWAGYFLKTGVEWEEGTAMYYIFSIDQYTTPFGYFILRLPAFMVLLTKLYLWFELLMPILIVCPYANGTTRLTACLMSFGFYSFLALCLELGFFTYSPIIAAIALLPTNFWDKYVPMFASYFSPEVAMKYWNVGSSLTLYYSTSGAHPLSTKTLLQLATTFTGVNCPILAAERSNQNRAFGSQSDEFGSQSDELGSQSDELGSQADDHGPNNSSDIAKFLTENHLAWVAVDNTGKRHARHRGVLAILGENPFTAPIVPYLQKLEKVMAFIYGSSVLIQSFTGIQNAIYYAGPTHAPAHARVVRSKVNMTDVVAVILLAYIVWWNIGTVNPELQPRGDAQWLGLALRIDQWWNMFTPSPMKDDGWFVIPAKLANGKEIDLFKPGGGALSYEKPTFVSRTFKDHRWRRYLMNLWSGAHQDKRLFYGRYLCRQWNWNGKGSVDKDYLLKTFRIVYLKEITLPEGRVKGPEPSVLWEHQC